MVLPDFIKFIETGKFFSRENHILLAVSGGVDSVVMAHLFHLARYKFAIAHCNFGLRGLDSEEDAEFVKVLALRMKVPFFSQKFDTAGFASQHGISIQMAARDLRYEWFEKVRTEQGYDYIATAHHLDDQVETFLINLIRGTGIAGLHGIPVKHGKVVRPLMFAWRHEIGQFARKHGISYRYDHSNSDTKYLRNKIRHDLIPALCSINQVFPNGLTETIRKIRNFEEIGKRALTTWCNEVLHPDGNNFFVEITDLRKASPIEAYAWALLSPFGFNETQVANVVDCLKKENRKTFDAESYRLIMERGKLFIIAPVEKVRDKEVKIALFKRKKTIKGPVPLTFTRISDIGDYVIPTLSTVASLDFEKLRFPLILRKWRPGDAFIPLGMNKKKKKLSDFFIDQKFTQQMKKATWLLCSGKDIVWIIGHRIDHRYRVTQATMEILSVMVNNELRIS